MDSVERSHQRQPWLFSTAGTSEMESKSKISLFLLCYQQHPMLFSLFFLFFFFFSFFPSAKFQSSRSWQVIQIQKDAKHPLRAQMPLFFATAQEKSRARSTKEKAVELVQKVSL